MRKLTFLFSGLLVLTLLLTACSGGSSSNGTQAPSNGVGTEAVSPGTGGSGVVTTPSVTQEMGAGTSVPNTGGSGLSGTSTATTGGVSGGYLNSTPTLEASSTAGLPGTGTTNNNPSLVSNLLNFKVEGQNCDQIGTVQDLLINLQTSMVDYVIISGGGSLGSSQKLVPVPFGMFSWSKNLNASGANNAPGSSTGLAGTGATPSPVLTDQFSNSMATGTAVPGTGINCPDQDAMILLASQSTLQNAPTTDMTALQSLSGPDYDLAWRNYWSAYLATGGSSSSLPLMGTGTPAPGAATSASGMGSSSSGYGSSMMATPMASSTAGVPGTGQNSIVLAKTLLGYSVQDSTGGNLGTVQDIVVNVRSGQVMYLLVVPAGASSLNNKVIPIPMSVVQLNNGNKAFTLVLPASMFQGAPSFSNTNLPDFTSVDWDKDIINYWSSGGSGNMAAPSATP